ncbi:hypothetical protein [Olleya sp. R77988]|uniref:DUF6630 family protein n=1 Tax=Olleya sp. R77988 TaxID=3093875 RepID=UPI0037CBB4E2
MNIIRTFIHTNRDIHGADSVQEFLLPNIVDLKPNFIGMTSGKTYDKGLIVGTSRKWDEHILFGELNKVKRIGFFGRKKKKRILKNYISQIIKTNEEFPYSIVELDNEFNLVSAESMKDFLSRSKPKPKKLSDKVKESYLNLAKVCLNENDHAKFQKFASELKNYDGHWEHGTTLNFVNDYLNKNKILLFMVLDWKAGIDDFNWNLASALENNFNRKIDLPSPNDYPERASVSFDNVFCDYKNLLNKSDLELSFIDTDSDQYVILVHPISDKETVGNSINGIELKEMKINCT